MSGRRHTHNGILNQQNPSRSRQLKANDAKHDAIVDDDENKDDGSVIENSSNQSTQEEIWNFVLQQLIFSRCILLAFQCFINWIMWDWTTDAFKGIQKPTEPFDKLVNFFIGGLSNWDSRHFLHIAEFGYTWESALAFFPLFPMILRLCGSLIYFFIPFISFRYSMIVAGVIISNVSFVAAGLVLFKLIHKITGNLKESLIAVYVFCWNPASIFFSACYTESLYALITFFGMYTLEQQPFSRTNQILSAIIFSFAFMTRSNGFLNVGYIGFALLVETVMKKHKGRVTHFAVDGTLVVKAIKKIPLLLFYVLIIVLPLRIFSYAIEEKFCHSISNHTNPWILEYGKNESVVFPGMLEKLTWCNSLGNEFYRPSLISLFMPPYYGVIQQKYWTVGFMQYWKFRKIPLFIIASPTLGFVFYGVYTLLNDILNDKRMINHVLTDRRHPIPYAIHSLFIAFCGIFIYNVESSIRLIFSSSPFIYLTLARLMSRQTPKIKVPEDLLEPFAFPFLYNYATVKPLRFLMLFYLLGYFIFGTLMHVNWLPFV
jgi:phosphatidylinositol glycan class V